jgi:acyl-CoA thioester hydrolase
MPRIKIELPDEFRYRTSLDVRITDLNYGSHVGNDRVLSFLHEARVRYLHSLEYSELNMAGVGLIMADASLIFKNEMFYGDELRISIRPVECTRVGFDLIYLIEKKSGTGYLEVVIAKTAMICYNYELKKVSAMPESAKIKLFS